jgi:putative DNA primase/helicase
MPYTMKEMQEALGIRRYDLNDLPSKEVPSSAVDVELSGGKSAYDLLPQGLQGRLDESDGDSDSDFAVCCELAKYTKNGKPLQPKHICETFRISTRGQQAEMRGHDLDDYAPRTVRAAIAKVTKGKNVKDDERNYHLSDLGNSERLAELFGERLRYCAEQKAWYCWNGKHWAKNDVTGAPMQMAKKVVKRMYVQAAELPDDARLKMMKWAFSSETRQRLDAMIALCRDIRPIRLEKFAEFDRSLYLLTFLNGTTDLRSGEMKGHDPLDLITKLIRHDFDPRAKCPNWIKFLGQAVGENNVDYLQLCLGYSITGETLEKKMFLCCGPRDRGKTTLLAMLGELLGDVAARIMVESLLVTDRHGFTSSNTQSDLSNLAGARLVTSSEPERSGKLSSSRIKQLTQGMGSMRTTRKYENTVEFLETYKIWLDMNGLPAIEDDDATWARLVPIYFHKPPSIDKRLRIKLRAEAKGILAWLVKGARLWQERGLGEMPEDWRATHKSWREHQNKFHQFVHDCCELVKNATATSHALQKAQHVWAGHNDAMALNNATLAKSLEDIGCTKHRAKGGVRIWKGIKMKDRSVDE